MRAGRWVLVATLPLSLLVLAPAALRAQDAAAGKPVYDQWCAGCHGVDGKGEGTGAATMLPRPRDFTRAQYQIRTTGSGELPTDADILHVINVGMPNTAMPGWEELLSETERNDLVAYLKSLSRFFEGAAPAPLELTDGPGVSDEGIADGKATYEKIECMKCHGTEGRADGTSATTLKDDLGNPIDPANLTQNWLFNGGGTAADIYHRLRTGLDGTPMPTFSDLIASGIVTDDQLWNLAYYVRSLSPEDAPEVREVITAAVLVEGEQLPTSPTDARWATVERFYVPLVGQIILKPRWYSPRVSNLWVQALHDSTEVAMLVSWSDPSSSPDSAWMPFAQRVVDLMGPKDEGSTWVPGSADQLVVQFPQTLTTGMERPYFLQGDARRPAYLWNWRSDRNTAVEMVAKGFGTGQEQAAGSQQVTASASWANGEWRVLFRRTLSTSDTTADLQMPGATVVPVAFQAWDGDNGEAGTQAAVSTWYFLALEEATPATVFVAPVLAFLLTAVLGVVLVSRAQKREKEG